MLVLLASLSGCAGGLRSDYQRCLEAPNGHGNVRYREAFTSSDGLVWGDWDRGAMQPRAPVQRLQLTLQNCLYSVQAEGEAARWTLGGFTYVDVSSFGQDPSGRRVGFTASDSRDGAYYAVIDGVKSPPYKEILRRPTFSRNGRHAGYLARTADGAVVVVDGQVAFRARDVHPLLFDVLDDGGFAAAPKREDGSVVAMVGDVVSPPVDDLCDSRLPVIRPSGHFAFVGKRSGDHVVIVDGRHVPAPGLPGGCEVLFSDDDSRFGWIAVHAGPAGLQSSEIAAVIDGEILSLSGTTADLRFQGRLAIVRTSHADPSGNSIHGQRKWESVHWLTDLPDPAVPPTEDSYFPPDTGLTLTWERVRIGSSIGPRFDRIDWSTLVAGEDGHVRYTGERGSARLEVVDNVLVQPRGERPALRVPDPAPPDPARVPLPVRKQ